MSSQPHFDYPWWLSYGHLPIIAVFAILFALAIARKWPKFWMFSIGAMLLWSVAAFIAARFVLNINGRASLPTQQFLPAGTGRVLDIGAGTGRSSLMVLESRPQATVVALDLFGDSFDHHFGPGDKGELRLQTNLRAVGLERRASIQTGDMRQLPFPDQSFEGIVSAYAMDHLRRTDSIQALHEAARVLKPGGDFLLMVIENEKWSKLMFGPLLSHGGTRGAAWWSTRTQEAGLPVIEQGIQPGTFYLLARKPAEK